MYSEVLAPTIARNSERIMMFMVACKFYKGRKEKEFNYMVRELAKELEMSEDEIRYKVIINVYPKLEL